MELSLKAGDLEEDMLKIQYKIFELEEKIQVMEKSCCLQDSMLKQSMVLERLTEEFSKYNLKLEKLDENFKRHEKFLYILTGVIITLEFLGIGDKIRLLLH